MKNKEFVLGLLCTHRLLLEGNGITKERTLGKRKDAMLIEVLILLFSSRHRFLSKGVTLKDCRGRDMHNGL